MLSERNISDSVEDEEVNALSSMFKGRSLLEMTVDDFNTDPHIIEIETTDSIYNAIKLLSLNYISSVPVWSSEEERYIGYIEIKDVINVLCDISVSAHGFKSLHALLTHLLKTEGSSMKLSTIASRHPFQYVYEGASIHEVIQLMKTGVSRVPVLFKDSGKIQHIVSQTDVIYHLAMHIDELDASKVSRQLWEAGIGNRKLVTITNNETAFQALQVMKEHHLCAIPVIDEKNKEYLLTTISESDIIMAAAWFLDDDLVVEWTDIVGLFNFFNQPILSFVHTVRTSPIGKRPKSSRLFPTAVTVHPKDRIMHIIAKLASSGLHRLYALDSENTDKVVGVVSLVDLINYLF